MQHIPSHGDQPSSPNVWAQSLQHLPITTFRISESVELDAVGTLPIALRIGERSEQSELRLPPGPIGRTRTETQYEIVTLQSTSSHRLDAANRWKDACELQGQIGRQQSTCITISGISDCRGFIVPAELYEGATLVAVRWPKDKMSPEFAIYELRNGSFICIPPATPNNDAGIMHATQNLSHINEGLKVLKSAHSTAAADISLVIPSVARSALLSQALAPAIAQKVSGWTYLEDGNPDFTTDFSTCSAMESIVGFLACNLALAKRVRSGEFKVISSDFRAEPQLLALLNPDSVLAGYNYTFLSGTLSQYAARIGGHPLRSLLLDTARSLDAFAEKLLADGAADTSCDWWDLTTSKLGDAHRRLDALAYRTLRYDPKLPQSVEGIPVIQVPHPVAPLTISREEAREALAKELKFDPKTAKVVVVPGLSDDGQFEQRLRALARIVSKDTRLVMVSPLDPEKLADICRISAGTPRVHGIGFRDKWGEVLVACDAAVIRGSWGEILDCIRAGVVPIFSSPGIIEPGSSRSRDLFLHEVLGERAMNLALLFDALEKEGVPRTILKDLIVGSSDDDSWLENAISRATEPAMTSAVQATFKRIRRDGVEQLVDTYAWLRKLGRKPELHEVEFLHRRIWGDI